MILKYVKLFEEYTQNEFIQFVLPELYKNLEINYLGNGGNGVAYSLGGNFVLKITNHIEEADTAAWLIHNNFIEIATIYNVYKINTKEKFDRSLRLRFPYWDNTFFIIEEKLDTSESEYIGEFLRDFILNHPFKQVKQTLLTALNKNEAYKFYKNTEYKEIYLEIRQLLRNLKIDGLNYYDFSEGNVGRKKNGQLAIFDVYFNNKKGNIKTIDLNNNS